MDLERDQQYKMRLQYRVGIEACASKGAFNVATERIDQTRITGSHWVKTVQENVFSNKYDKQKDESGKATKARPEKLVLV